MLDWYLNMTASVGHMVCTHGVQGIWWGGPCFWVVLPRLSWMPIGTRL